MGRSLRIPVEKKTRIVMSVLAGRGVVRSGRAS